MDILFKKEEIMLTLAITTRNFKEDLKF